MLTELKRKLIQQKRRKEASGLFSIDNWNPVVQTEENG